MIVNEKGEAIGVQMGVTYMHENLLLLDLFVNTTLLMDGPIVRSCYHGFAKQLPIMIVS